MKIAVFGDSYGDTNGDINHISWPYKLANQLEVDINDLVIYSLSGTSTWWSYQKFLQSYKNYDVIIFCYSAFHRWPVLPSEMAGQHWRVPGYPLDNWSVISKFNEVYFDIFDNNLLKFIASNIFTTINELCKQENKYLINLLAFKADYDLTRTTFPIFEDANEVSWNEKVLRDGKVLTMREVICDLGEFDERICHLNVENNRRLALIFKQAVSLQSKSLHSKLFVDYEWSEYDDTVSKLYEEKYDKNFNYR